MLFAYPSHLSEFKKRPHILEARTNLWVMTEGILCFRLSFGEMQVCSRDLGQKKLFRRFSYHDFTNPRYDRTVADTTDDRRYDRTCK